MKEMAALTIISYLLISFIMASINFLEWGIIARVGFVALAICLIFINKKFDV